MPTVARSRVIGASAATVWDLVADPHNLPRWWPETDRVEDVDGAPFAGFLQSAAVEIRLDDRGDGTSAVTIEARRRLRGMSRLGSPMMRRATGRTLERALDGIEDAVPAGAGGGKG
jgi:carbon monoxide dehydrogenase subunit G